LTGLGSDTLTGIEEARLAGGPGHNVLDARAFTGSLVTFEGQGGDDDLIGRAGGLDRVRALGDVDFTLGDAQLTGLGSDTLVDIDEAELIGNSGDNVFDASAFTLGKVRISAGAGHDTLLGGSAGDSLDGGRGDDHLTGGAGKDSLAGGAGADIFRLLTVGDSGPTLALRDVIRDFDAGQGDRLDLSAIDADSTVAGRQAFSRPVEGAGFSGVFAVAASLYFDTTAHTLYGNVDADGAVDFSIQLNGVVGMLDALLV
jgi:Ca2+-binding RTX toxin-like protein